MGRNGLSVSDAQLLQAKVASLVLRGLLPEASSRPVMDHFSAERDRTQGVSEMPLFTVHRLDRFRTDLIHPARLWKVERKR